MIHILLREALQSRKELQTFISLATTPQAADQNLETFKMNLNKENFIWVNLQITSKVYKFSVQQNPQTLTHMKQWCEHKMIVVKSKEVSLLTFLKILISLHEIKQWKVITKTLDSQ